MRQMSKNRLNSHDRFTKAMMSNKKVVREFFEVHPSIAD